MTKKLLRNRIWIIIIVMVIALFPKSLNLPAETNLRSVVVGLGIDLDDTNEIELSAQVLMPQFNLGYKENVKFFSSKGSSVLEAMQTMSVHIGKVTGLGNTSVVVFGEKACNNGIANTLDFFIRSKRINDNAILIATKSTAKELIEASAQLEDLNLNLNNISKYNDTSLISTICTVEKFMSDYYSPYNSTLVPLINLVSDDNEGIDTQKNSGGGNSAGGGSNDQSMQASATPQSNTILSNEGDCLIFKNGKSIATLSSEEIIGYNILNTANQRGIFSINDVSDALYNKAKITFSVSNKKLSNHIYFTKTGIPRINYNLDYTFKVEHVEDNYNPAIINSEKFFITKEVESKLKVLIQNYIATTINLSKDNNADFLLFMDRFKKWEPLKWDKFVRTLSNNESPLNKIEVFVNVEIKEFL